MPVPLNQRYPTFFVTTVSTRAFSWPYESPSSVALALFAAAGSDILIRRTVSYSSMRRRMSSPSLTNSIGYGCSMMYGMPFGAQFFVGSSAIGSNAACVARALGVNGRLLPQKAGGLVVFV